MATGAMATPGVGGVPGALVPGTAAAHGWKAHLSSWTQADLAVASSDFRRAYALSVAEGVLEVKLFDGCRPDTSIDMRRSGISYLLAQQSAAGRTKARPAGMGSPGTARPLAAAFAPIGAQDDVAALLVLLSSGHLLSVDPVRLGIEAVLGFFPGVCEVAGGSPLAVLQEHAWAVIAEGTHLGLTPVDSVPPESAASTAGGRPKGADLPKGCHATVVLAYPGEDSLLLVGCAGGRLLLYHGSVGYKRQVSALSLSLVQSLDTSGAQPSPSRGMMSYLRGARTPRAALEFAISDAFVLAGGEDGPPGLLAAGGRGIGRSEGGGALVVWRVALDAWRDQASSGKKTTSNPCSMFAKGRCPIPVLRVLLLAPGRMGSTAPTLLSLDRNFDISIWTVHQDQLVVASIVPSTSDEAVPRTFCLTGSTYMLIGLKAASNEVRVGWLDLASLLASTSADVHLTPPLSDRTTSVLGPPLRMPVGASGGSLDIPAGGEVFFVSESQIRSYRAVSGRTTEIPISAPGLEWRALAVLDVFSPSPSVAATHLLVAVVMLSGGLENRGVWCITTNGEVVRRVPGAFDGAFLGRSQADLRIVTLTGNDRDRNVSAQVGPAVGTASGAAGSVAVPGVQRVLSGPPCGAQLLLYWGSGLARGPLRMSLNVPPDGAGLGLATHPLVNLPLSGPAELVAASWDNQRSEGPWCLAAAAVHVLWVIRFVSSAGAGPAGRSRVPELQTSLVAWIDLRTTLLSAGRVTSLAWLRQHASSDTGMPGVVLVSTLWGVMHWSVLPGEPPRPLVLYDRPQLLAGALLDRLLCVEVQSGISIFSGADRMKAPYPMPPRGPKARVRARPVSFMEAATSASRRASAQACAESAGVVRDSDWRLVPAVLPEGLPEETLRGLWPIASTSDAPPQLCQSAPAFHRTATAAGDEFRALAAIISGLQSGGGLSAAAARRARAGGGGAAEESRAAGQVEEAVLRNRLDPARAEFLCAASDLLLDCASRAGASNSHEDTSTTSLSLASRGLAKHDLLPFGSLVAVVLRGVRENARAGHGWHRLFLPACKEDNTAVAKVGKRGSPYHWTQALCSSSPLATALLARSQEHNTRRRSPKSGDDFSANALLNQRFSEPPAVRRPAQVVQPTGQAVCQLHTATLMQWLGLGSTQVQVRVLHAILQEGETAAAPSSSSQGASAMTARGPPKILANGLLVYWRCADGEGTSLRDSGGCNRFGELSGATAWRGPLPEREPLETVDDWGSNLAPNFGVAFQAGGELKYNSVEGAAGSEDRQMLSLVGGSRNDGAGQRHLRAAIAESGSMGADDGDTAESAQPGWAIELWVRIIAGQNEMLLFSRHAGSANNAAQHNLAWTYNARPPSFSVHASGRSLLSGQVDIPELGAGDWVHLALRSNLSMLEVWAGASVVARSSPGTQLESSAPVENKAGLRFGSPGLELTEIRVWGVFRSDAELLEQQRQPLLLRGGSLSEERKQLKVRIRARGAEATGPDLAAGGSGMFGLTQLVAPASRTTRRRQDKEPSAAPKNEGAFDFGPPLQDEAAADPWGAFGGGFGESDRAQPAEAPWASGPPASAWPAFESEKKPDFAPTPAVAVAPSEPIAPIPAVVEAVVLSSADEDASSRISRMTKISSRISHPPPPASDHAEKCVSCGSIILANHQFCRRCGARKPHIAAPVRQDDSDEASVVTSSVQGSSPSMPGRRGSREVDHIDKAIFHAPGLEEVLPAPMPNERGMVHEADSKLFAAVHALEHKSYSLASTNFRSVIQVLIRQLPRRAGGGPPQLSAATRARLEAASAYATLCVLLHRCEELRQAVGVAGKEGHSLGHMASGHYNLASPEMLRRLCSSWACVLRIAKAPHDTVRYAVQGMATFFTLARAVGGWSAAHQVASALLARCHDMLTESELKQVEYVDQATSVGRVARGATSDAACGQCPSCARALDPLAPVCGYCFAEVVVCFRDLRLCDGRRALFCDVCSAAVSERKSVTSRHESGGVPSQGCQSCGVGELQPRGPRSRGEILSF